MPKHYPDDLLRSLRNYIPIDRVVAEMLHLELRRKASLLRFRCPMCRGFHTATQPKTNLARCFDCQKNFNPIDMVMAATRCRFVEAVERLKKNFHELL